MPQSRALELPVAVAQHSILAVFARVYTLIAQAATYPEFLRRDARDEIIGQRLLRVK